MDTMDTMGYYRLYAELLQSPIDSQVLLMYFKIKIKKKHKNLYLPDLAL